MDRTNSDLTVEDFRRLIKQIMQDYAREFPAFDVEGETELLIDDTGGHYQIWHVGWKGWKRIHFCVLHIDIKDGKIWVQHDGIYAGITQKLLDAGVPHKSIVIGFHAPSQRKYTPFAVA